MNTIDAITALLSIASPMCKAKALDIIGEDNVALLLASQIASLFHDYDLSPTLAAEALDVARNTAADRILSAPSLKREPKPASPGLRSN